MIEILGGEEEEEVRGKGEGKKEGKKEGIKVSGPENER